RLDEPMLFADFQRDRPVPAEFLVGSAENPERGGEYDRSERDGPCIGRIIGSLRDAAGDVEAGQDGYAEEGRGEPDGVGRRAAIGHHPPAPGPALERVSYDIPGNDAKHPDDLPDGSHPYVHAIALSQMN